MAAGEDRCPTQGSVTKREQIDRQIQNTTGTPIHTKGQGNSKPRSYSNQMLQQISQKGVVDIYMSEFSMFYDPLLTGSKQNFLSYPSTWKNKLQIDISVGLAGNMPFGSNPNN